MRDKKVIETRKIKKLFKNDLDQLNGGHFN
jgi:hypothetical protein